MNPSRGPAPPSASTPSAFRLAGKPPPHTRSYGAPLSTGGGLCNTLQSGRFWRVSLATLASGKLSANTVARVPLAGHPAPPPVGSLLSTSTKEELPCRRPEAVPRAPRSRRATPSWRQRAGHADSRRLFPAIHTARADEELLVYNAENATSARASGVAPPEHCQRGQGRETWSERGPGHPECNMQDSRTVTATGGATVSLLGLLAKIKCSICSYQFNI